MDDIKNIFEDKTKLAYAIVFLIIGIFAFVLLGKYDTGNFLRLVKSQRETHNSLRMLKSLAGYNEYTNQFDAQFLASTSSSKLMEIMGKLAEKNGIAPGVVKPLETRVVAGYRIVRVTAEGNTPYSNLVHLVAALEGQKEYISVENISIKMPEADSVSVGGLSAGQSDSSVPKPDSEGVAFTLTISAIDRGLDGTAK